MSMLRSIWHDNIPACSECDNAAEWWKSTWDDHYLRKKYFCDMCAEDKEDLVKICIKYTCMYCTGSGYIINSEMEEQVQCHCNGAGYIEILSLSQGTFPKGTTPSGPAIRPIATSPRDKPLNGNGTVMGSYGTLGGMKKEIAKVREIVELPLKNPNVFASAGIEAPRGVILHGPPGTGKTALARAVAGETAAKFVSINASDIFGKYYGDTEKNIKKLFEDAKKEKTIIFIDEIDALTSKRNDETFEQEKRILSLLLIFMDGLQSGSAVIIAATNRIDSIDPALRRPGRFDREVYIGPPTKEGRMEILQIYTSGMPLNPDVGLNELAAKTHGFTGADIKALCTEAGYSAIRRGGKNSDIKITTDDFNNALDAVKPSSLRHLNPNIPATTWDDVGCNESIKREIREIVEWPMKYPNLFKDSGYRSPKGILLHGPPGTGKTLLAKALAHETSANFINIKGPELLSKWLGDSERGVRELFADARRVAPCIMFFDEIDSLVPRRTNDLGQTQAHVNIVSQMLIEMDGLDEMKNVLVVGATNRLDMIDNAILRPGRFDKIFEVPKPDMDGRMDIFKICMRGKKTGDDVDVRQMAAYTDGCTGADISYIVDEAVRNAVRRCVETGNTDDSVTVTKDDFESAIKTRNF